MNIGMLDQRVVIERKSVARDSALGSEVITWVTLATVWACMREVREPARGGDEAVSRDQRIVQGRSTCTVRWRSDVTTDMRVRWPARSRVLQITSQAEMGRREWLELSCEEFSPA